MPAESDGLPVLRLGLAEQTAYQLLIDHPSDTIGDLLGRWPRAEPLEIVLAQLEQRALAESDAGPPVRYRAVAPAVAFDALLIKHEDELERASRQVELLVAAYQARPTQPDTATVIEVVNGARGVSQRLRQLHSGARRQIDYLATPRHFCTSDAVERELHRGLTCRAIYDRTAIESPGAVATVERLINAGQLARVLPDLPLGLYLADDKVAALLSHPATVPALIVVHPSALLDALVAFFDGLWQRALPLHPPPHGRTGPRASTARLITLLLSGLTDEAISRQLGLSHRTIQRRVAALMRDLGAHTRFQAGVQAALLGKGKKAAPRS